MKYIDLSDGGALSVTNDPFSFAKLEEDLVGAI